MLPSSFFLNTNENGMPWYARRERLDHMMVHMTERLAGKMGNANNNAFKLRKLFKMYDTEGTGKVRFACACRWVSMRLFELIRSERANATAAALLQACCGWLWTFHAALACEVAVDPTYVGLQIHIEDFRVMTETVGMQLDDDSLLALFCRVRRDRSPHTHAFLRRLVKLSWDPADCEVADKRHVAPGCAARSRGDRVPGLHAADEEAAG